MFQEAIFSQYTYFHAFITDQCRPRQVFLLKLSNCCGNPAESVSLGDKAIPRSALVREKWPGTQRWSFYRWRNRRKFDTKSHSGPFIYRKACARSSHSSHFFSVKARAAAAGRYCFENWAPSGREKSRTHSPAPKTHRQGGTNAWWSGPAVSAKSWLSLERPSRAFTHSHSHKHNAPPFLLLFYF